MEERIGVRGIVERVERGALAVVESLRFAIRAPLVAELSIGLLDVRGVGEHGEVEVDGCGGGVDGPAESVAHQGRKIARVVHMRVGENYGIDGIDREREMTVAFEGFLASSLI